MKNVKKRNWTFEIYPTEDYIKDNFPLCPYDGSSGWGTAPDDFLDILKKSGLSGAISPLHQFDTNPDGTFKKPHYHVILIYSGPTTFNSVKNFISSFNSPIPQFLESVRGIYRYFTHKDNPEKFQYDENDIISFGGFNISNFVELTKFEVNSITKEICRYIISNDIFEYSDLIDVFLDFEDSNYFDVVSHHTIFFDSYIRSRREKLRSSNK